MIGLLGRLAVRRVSLGVLVMLVLAGGAYAHAVMPRLQLPKTVLPVFAIEARWGGASAERMEERVTARLVGAARQVRGVMAVDSRSAQINGAGTAVVLVQVGGAREEDVVRVELRERLAALERELPPELEGPVLLESSTGRAPRPEILIALTGEQLSSEQLRATAVANVIPAMRMAPGVSTAALVHDPPTVATITPRPLAMAAGVGSDAILRAIADEARSADAGSIIESGTRWALTAGGERRIAKLTDGTLEIPAAGGNVRLSDIADIEVKQGRPPRIHRVNGAESVVVSVVGSRGATVAELGNTVDVAARALAGKLPPGTRLTKLQDTEVSEPARLALERRMVLGLVLCAITLATLSRSWRVPAIIASIGASGAAATLIAMLVAGASVTLLTAPAMVTAAAVLLIPTVCLADTARRIRADGCPPSMAALRALSFHGRSLVVASAAGSAMCIPLWFASDAVRLRYGAIVGALVVTIIAGACCCALLLPLVAGILPARDGSKLPRSGDLRRWAMESTAGRRRRGIEEQHPGCGRTGLNDGRASWPLHDLIRFASAHPVIVLVAYAALSALLGIRALGDESDMHARPGPSSHSRPRLDIAVELADGEPYESVDSIAAAFEQLMLDAPGADRVITTIDAQRARIIADFRPGPEAGANAAALQEDAETLAAGFGGLGIAITGSHRLPTSGATRPPRLRLTIRSVDQHQLDDVAAGIRRQLGEIDRVRDIRLDGHGGAPFDGGAKAFEAVVRVRHHDAARAGVTPHEIDSHVSRFVRQDASATTVRLGNQEVRVVVNGIVGRAATAATLAESRMMTRHGGTIPLRAVADIEIVPLLPAIVREDGYYIRTISFGVSGPADLGKMIHASIRHRLELPDGVQLMESTLDSEAARPKPTDENIAAAALSTTDVSVHAVILIVTLLAMLTAAVLESLKLAAVAAGIVASSLAAAGAALRSAGIAWSADAAAGMIAASCASLAIAVTLLTAITNVPPSTRPRRNKTSNPAPSPTTQAIAPPHNALCLGAARTEGLVDAARLVLTSSVALAALLLPLLLRPGFGSIVWDGAWLMVAVAGTTAGATTVLVAPAILTIFPDVSSTAAHSRPSASASGTCTPAPAASPSP